MTTLSDVNQYICNIPSSSLPTTLSGMENLIGEEFGFKSKVTVSECAKCIMNVHGELLAQADHAWFSEMSALSGGVINDNYRRIADYLNTSYIRPRRDVMQKRESYMMFVDFATCRLEFPEGLNGTDEFVRLYRESRSLQDPAPAVEMTSAAVTEASPTEASPAEAAPTSGPFTSNQIYPEIIQTINDTLREMEDGVSVRFVDRLTREIERMINDIESGTMDSEYTEEPRSVANRDLYCRTHNVVKCVEFVDGKPRTFYMSKSLFSKVLPDASEDEAACVICMTKTASHRCGSNPNCKPSMCDSCYHTWQAGYGNTSCPACRSEIVPETKE